MNINKTIFDVIRQAVDAMTTEEAKRAVFETLKAATQCEKPVGKVVFFPVKGRPGVDGPLRHIELDGTVVWMSQGRHDIFPNCKRVPGTNRYERIKAV